MDIYNKPGILQYTILYIQYNIPTRRREVLCVLFNGKELKIKIIIEITIIIASERTGMKWRTSTN